MSDKFTTDDIATTLSVNKRTAQRYVENLLNKEQGKISFDKDVFNLIIERHANDNQTTEEESEGVTEFFTTEQYTEFQKRLIEYPMIKRHIEALQKDIEYHKEQYDTLMSLHKEFVKMHEVSLKNITQRSWIEAKEKGLDK